MAAVMLMCWLPVMAQTPEEQPDSLEIANDEFAITPDSVLLGYPDQNAADMDESLIEQADEALDESIQTEAMPRATTFVPDPIRALWLGLIIPGGGQIYNRKYWKLPLIYGGFLGCAYALTWNNQMLSDYSQAYLDIMDDDPNTKSYEKMLPIGYDISGREDQFKDIFKNKKNYYRKYRDMSIFAFAAVYLLAVIDAYVDAELSSFDISQDLTMKMAPAVISTQPLTSQRTLCSNNGQGLGLAIHLNF